MSKPERPAIGLSDSEPCGPVGSPIEVRERMSRETLDRRLEIGRDFDTDDPEGPEPGSPDIEGRSRPMPSRRSTARGRVGPPERVHIGAWDGWQADQVDPTELLLQIAHNVMLRHEIFCGMHNFEMPSSLREPRGPKLGWSGEIEADPACRDWVWAKIARRCLRRRISPVGFLDEVGMDFSDTDYPPPIDHYLDQIEVRSPGLRTRELASVRFKARAHRLNFQVSLFCQLYEGGVDGALWDCLDVSGTLPVYCHAFDHGCYQLAFRLAPKALVQYCCAKASYDEVYGGLIPAPLRWVGDALYELVDREGD